MQDPEIVENLYELAAERVRDGVILDGSRIVEIKPWDVSEKEKKDFHDWLGGRIDLHPDQYETKNLSDEILSWKIFSGSFSIVY